jgi:predicted RNA-binding protein with PIN domain
MATLYYIDGYNAVHHAPALVELARHDLERARDTLVDYVAHFCSITGERARVVFDGQGRQAQPGRRPTAPGVEVIFAPGHKSADAYIERAVYKTADRREIVVVTADRGIRDLCMGLGALVMSPEAFLNTARQQDTMQSAQRRVSGDGNVLGRIEDRIEADTRTRLQALRDKLEKK